MRKGTTLAVLLLGAIAVLAIGSYATADSGKKNFDTGPMSGYLEGAPADPSRAAQTARSKAGSSRAASITHSSTRASRGT